MVLCYTLQAMAKVKNETGEILEIVNFIKDHMVTNMATKDELGEFRSEANERFFEINGRLVSIEQDLKDIKRRITTLEDKLEKHRVVTKDELDEVWKHVAAIEKHLKMH